MKIAVILSGQLRKWEIGCWNQKWFWSDNKHNQVDYFAHTWSYSWDRTSSSKPYEQRDVSIEEFLKFTNIFKTKKALLDPNPQQKIGSNDHWAGLFYSFVRSLLLKQEYEKEHNFKYDIVIKSRPDICFDPSYFLHFPKLVDGVLHTTHGGLMINEYNMMNFNDCVFLGNNNTMDLLVNLLHYRIERLKRKEDNIHPMGPGVLMNEYFRDYGIYPIHTELPFQETLLKEGCPEDLDLFDKHDFKEIEKYFRNWYIK